MLLLHQLGSVKIGEVVRYTVTYTPSHDRILPSPDVLHLRIRNTSPLPLRAAFVHGPYTLSVSAYPSHYNPNAKFENPRRYGVPEFEPMLKAAGTWSCQLIVPDDIRQSAGMGAARGDFANADVQGNQESSASWVIEVTSQVIFSSSASVGFEILLARDEKSLSLSGSPVVKGQANIQQPGKVSDFQQSAGARDGHHPAQPKGLFSKAISLKVEDTASLWNTPKLPDRNSSEDTVVRGRATVDGGSVVGSENGRRQKKVHLVVITHGLHSNLGADMLYLKESIDATARQAKIDARARKAREKDSRRASRVGDQKGDEGEEDDSDDEEEVIVRGFSGNATRTERGIKFLGKRLARFILSMTYPDQPFLPETKKRDAIKDQPQGLHQKLSSSNNEPRRPYQITSISLVAHSLGGLVQTYAVAYIQKHSPQFFDLIRPINFIALATPFLGLSNENPLYVKFALDFGLVGRTGQDLGLTWRAPTIARSSWGALVGSLGETAHKRVMGESQPESKPLLRILPTGPAHVALKKFRNRTVYSNVVNDGIVPLRTSCLLFLDWQGLDRVEKARREAGLVGTVVGFGWAELTGTGMSSRKEAWTPDEEEPPALPGSNTTAGTLLGDSHEVPQPSSNAIVEDDRQSINLAATSTPRREEGPGQHSQTSYESPFSGFFNLFKTNDNQKTSKQKPPTSHSPKEQRIYKRSQTLNFDESPSSSEQSTSKVSAGQEYEDSQGTGMSAPPKTTFFESAGDLLNPKLPPTDFVLDPSKRARTIFHDRIYHPSDIPPPRLKKRSTGSLSMRKKNASRPSNSSPKKEGVGEASPPAPPNPTVGHQDSGLSTHDYDDVAHTDPDRQPDEVIDSSNMRVEEKIARAYHRDLSWRKVLVNLEPDAHNNIIVRRMFANAYGWPVIKHLVDSHFSDDAVARTRDDVETNAERAKGLAEGPDTTGVETKPVGADQANASSKSENAEKPEAEQDPPRKPTHERSLSLAREEKDTVSDLPTSQSNRSQGSQRFQKSPARLPSNDTLDSAAWSDRDFADSADESDLDLDIAYGRHFNAVPLPPSEETEKGGEPEERSSSPSWNWTEKIVGKGAARKTKPTGSQSPTDPGHISDTAPAR
ncbi:DUF676-domain-containing protein [Poronia punctata]|nr:DUF676-domain-containing protein [Poronia punctata]